MKKSLFLFVIAIACSQSEVSNNPTQIRYVDPTNGYSQMVVVQKGSQRTLYISGQIGKGETLETQMRDCLMSMQILLRREGADFEDLVKINTYIVDYKPEDLDTFRGVREEIFTDAITPASTLVGVKSLALPEWLIEIDAVAVVDGP